MVGALRVCLHRLETCPIQNEHPHYLGSSTTFETTSTCINGFACNFSLDARTH